MVLDRRLDLIRYLSGRLSKVLKRPLTSRLCRCDLSMDLLNDGNSSFVNTKGTFFLKCVQFILFRVGFKGNMLGVLLRTNFIVFRQVNVARMEKQATMGFTIWADVAFHNFNIIIKSIYSHPKFVAYTCKFLIKNACNCFCSLLFCEDLCFPLSPNYL